MNQEQPMTRRERRLLKKQAATQSHEKQQKKKFGGKIVGLILLGLLIVGAIYGLQRLAESTPDTTYTDTPVHWHAAFDVELCGEKQDFSSYGATTHAGSALLHTHGDGVIHIEGRILKKEDIALGKFFDNINIPFGRDQIMDKKDGDECQPGKPGQVKMFVNGVPNDEFREYIPKSIENAQDQVIRLVFE